MTQQYSLVFARETHSELLTAVLDGPHKVVTRRAEFAAAIAKRRPVVAYVDFDLLPQIDGDVSLPIIGIVDGTLAGAVQALTAFPWLSHLVSTAMLAGPQARSCLAMVRHRIKHDGADHHVLSPECVGRGALLAASNRREARLERVRDYFAAQNASAKTIATITDVAEELMTNALYDAPVEAGYYMSHVERTTEVELPPEHACEISYGIDRGNAFVRCRDPFGALKRGRLLAVLDRCSRKNVQLDETRGGAGLGFWRVFSSAAAISVGVIPGRLTDILVWVELRKKPLRQLQVAHLFMPDDQAFDGIGRFAADHDHDLMDDSFTALLS